MKKHICIGDIHGLPTWSEIVKKHSNEDVKYVFVGDYFDSFHLSAAKQIDNFKKIIEFKKENPEDVILLIGNHDWHYLPSANEHYSGFQTHFQFDIADVLKPAISECLLQASYMVENYLFTHAGVSEIWCKNADIKIDKDISININKLFEENPMYFSWSFGAVFRNPYGDEVNQTPFWIRPNSLEKSAIRNIDGIDKDIIHVVGHTQREKRIERYLTNYKKSIVIDRLPDREYLIINEDTSFEGVLI